MPYLNKYFNIFKTFVVILALFMPALTHAFMVKHNTSQRSDVIFPTNILIVKDPQNITGVRVNIPDRGPAGSDMNAMYEMLNRLDGFSLEPRITVPFDGPADPASLTEDNIYIMGLSGPHRTKIIGLDMRVYDPDSHVFSAHLDKYLCQNQTYGIIVINTVQAEDGAFVKRNPAFTKYLKDNSGYAEMVADLIELVGQYRGVPPQDIAAASIFTTQSITGLLEDVRKDLDSGAAFKQAGISNPVPDYNIGIKNELTMFKKSEIENILWKKRSIDVRGGYASTKKIGLPKNKDYVLVFGSFQSPVYREPADLVIPHQPTLSGHPKPLGKETVYFNLLMPAGEPPKNGFPLIIYGHGFGGNKNERFHVDEQFVDAGFAVVHINVPGFAGGPGGKIVVKKSDGEKVFLPDGGRAVANAIPGIFISRIGGFFAKVRSPSLPVAHRDGIRQQVIDLMALTRSFKNSGDINGDGSPEIDGSRVYYTGCSLGGVYGAIFTAIDPMVHRSVPNVGGGPVFQIRMLPSWKNLIIRPFLLFFKPSIFNAPLANFVEDLPQRGQPLKIIEKKGAAKVQDFFDLAEWLQEPGDPDMYARHLLIEPLNGGGPAEVVWYIAIGDNSMANPLSANVVRAGSLHNVTACFRADLVEEEHGFLWTTHDVHYFMRRPSDEKNLGPVSVSARELILEFFKTGELIDPDGEGPVFEVPIQEETLIKMQTGLNLR
jgi:hypothetical protein